jgi:hypothetical protein
VKTSVSGKHGILPDEGKTMVDRDIARLLHIRDAIDAIEGYAAVGHERFQKESITQDAIVWQLLLLNEATKHLSEELRASHPEFASERLRDLQEGLEHDLLTVDLWLVWRATQETLPELKQTIEAILRGVGSQNRVNQARFTEPTKERGPAMPSDGLVVDNRAEILRIAGKHGATRVRIFGSFGGGTARPDSDVDLLIDLEPGRHLLHLIAIKQDLEDLLGREVHVLTEAAISPYIRDEVLRSATAL